MLDDQVAGAGMGHTRLVAITRCDKAIAELMPISAVHDLLY
jgi:hypothetical protein